MKSYTKYLRLLLDFQFRIINPLLKLETGENYRFGDVEELSSLETFVIDELKVSAPGNLRLKLKRLKEVNILFMNFDRNYPKLSEKARNGLLQLSDFEKPFDFSLEIISPTIHLTPEFMKTLYQSVLYRQRSLLHLINQIEDLAGIVQGEIIPA